MNSLISLLHSASFLSVCTFKIRNGIEFHNAKTMDSKDVGYSINHHRGENSKSAAKGIIDPVTDVKALDKHTVQIS